MARRDGAAKEDASSSRGLEDAAQYAVAMAYRIRFVMQMNAREAMHLIELRSSPQGHPMYRRVAQEMHRLIGDVHPAIGAAFTYVTHETWTWSAWRRSAGPRPSAVPRRSAERAPSCDAFAVVSDVRVGDASASRGQRAPGDLRDAEVLVACWSARSAGPSLPSRRPRSRSRSTVGTVPLANPVEAVLDGLGVRDVEPRERWAVASTSTRRDSRCGGRARRGPESGSGHRGRWEVRWRSRCR